jgi:glutathione S-transferase
MNLGDKAPWHLDFNNGFVPILESPDGTMINESAVISEFASAYAKPADGIKILPFEGKNGDLSAAMETAKMRLAMQDFDKFMPKLFVCL